jgi:hypothetical protein
VPQWEKSVKNFSSTFALDIGLRRGLSEDSKRVKFNYWVVWRNKRMTISPLKPMLSQAAVIPCGTAALGGEQAGRERSQVYFALNPTD